MRVVLFGVGRYIDTIESLLQDEVEVAFYLDNNNEKQMNLRNGKRVYAFSERPCEVYDYVVICVYNYHCIEKQLLESGYKENCIIPFYKKNLDFCRYEQILKPIQSMQFSLECRMDYLDKQLKFTTKIISENLIYEMEDRASKEHIVLPRICTVEETCEKIIQDRVSVSRFGDGEFQIILGRDFIVFEKDYEELGIRLKEVLISNIEHHIVALADDYGCMQEIRDENKYSIRRYMSEQKRREHYKYIDMKKQYYNAYISRPYVIYSHGERERAENRFNKLKSIWDNQKILFIEGEFTRMGVGNDLFDNALSIERILAPNQNAFSVYQKIIDTVLRVDKDRLILIALGPTATVLAYDLAKQGYWAIDIGHLDLEYEWFLKGQGYSHIPGKYNNEVPGGTVVEEIKDEKYSQSIISKIVL